MNNVVNLASNDYSSAQIALIKNTVANDTNREEFDLFITVARRAGLDPFRKQISAIVFNKASKDSRKMAIITTIDGLRTIAARSGRYRPDEDEPDFTYDAELKGLTNPLGLVKARVRLWIADQNGKWNPVTGVAYWDEFAPIKEEASEGYDWVETGEVYADSGKPKKRKVAREGSTIVKKLDTGGNWGKMGRVMLAKCAEAQALRKAFPEDLSGLYEGAEFDQAREADLTPSEQIEHVGVTDRLARIGGASGIVFQFDPRGALENVPIGQLADRIIKEVRDCGGTAWLNWFESVNAQQMREFWARAKGDALEVRKVLDARRIELIRAESEDQGTA